jgi:hypothetical protein
MQSSTKPGSGWDFVRPFDWSLWLAVALTLLVVPVAVFLLEFLSLKRRIYATDWAPGLQESLVRRRVHDSWHSMPGLQSCFGGRRRFCARAPSCKADWLGWGVMGCVAKAQELHS